MEITRDTTIKTIRANLRRRSSRAWSVTGGRGTAWGWITIDVPPSQHTCNRWHRWDSSGIYCRDCGLHHTLTEARYHCKEHVCDDDCLRNYLSPEDQHLLARLLGLDHVHHQGQQIAPEYDSRREYLARSAGCIVNGRVSKE